MDGFFGIPVPSLNGNIDDFLREINRKEVDEKSDSHDDSSHNGVI